MQFSGLMKASKEKHVTSVNFDTKSNSWLTENIHGGGDSDLHVREDRGDALAGVAARDDRVHDGVVVVEDGRRSGHGGERAEGEGGKEAEGLEGEHLELDRRRVGD